MERLLREEAAVLLRPGMTFELAQLREQIARAVTRLAESLIESKLTVVDVELAVDGALARGHRSRDASTSSSATRRGATWSSTSSGE